MSVRELQHEDEAAMSDNGAAYEDEHEQLLIYPTVKRIEGDIDCFVVPHESIMTKELLAYAATSTGSEEKDDDRVKLRGRWADKIHDGFNAGEELALETLAIACRKGDDGKWGLGKILRAAILAEEFDEPLEYVARGFIYTIVSAAISGRASLAKRIREGKNE
jgi:hypothetical protein